MIELPGVSRSAFCNVLYDCNRLHSRLVPVTAMLFREFYAVNLSRRYLGVLWKWLGRLNIETGIIMSPRTISAIRSEPYVSCAMLQEWSIHVSRRPVLLPSRACYRDDVDDPSRRMCCNPPSCRPREPCSACLSRLSLSFSRSLLHAFPFRPATIWNFSLQSCEIRP